MSERTERHNSSLVSQVTVFHLQSDVCQSAVAGAASDMGWSTTDDVPPLIASQMLSGTASALVGRPTEEAWANAGMCGTSLSRVAARYLQCAQTATEAALAKARESVSSTDVATEANETTFESGMVEVALKAIGERSAGPPGTYAPLAVAAFFRDALAAGSDSGRFAPTHWASAEFVAHMLGAPTTLSPVGRDQLLDVLVHPAERPSNDDDEKSGQPGSGSKSSAVATMPAIVNGSLAALHNKPMGSTDMSVRFAAPALALLTTRLRIQEKVDALGRRGTTKEGGGVEGATLHRPGYPQLIEQGRCRAVMPLEIGAAPAAALALTGTTFVLRAATDAFAAVEVSARRPARFSEGENRAADHDCRRIHETAVGGVAGREYRRKRRPHCRRGRQ